MFIERWKGKLIMTVLDIVELKLAFIDGTDGIDEEVGNGDFPLLLLLFGENFKSSLVNLLEENLPFLVSIIESTS